MQEVEVSNGSEEHQKGVDHTNVLHVSSMSTMMASSLSVVSPSLLSVVLSTSSVSESVVSPFLLSTHHESVMTVVVLRSDWHWHILWQWLFFSWHEFWHWFLLLWHWHIKFEVLWVLKLEIKFWVFHELEIILRSNGNLTKTSSVSSPLWLWSVSHDDLLHLSSLVVHED